MFESLGLSYYEIPPKTKLLYSVIRHEIGKVVFDEMLKQCYYEFRIFTYDLHISRSFNGNGLIGVATFIEANHYLPVHVITDGKLAFAAISFSLS